MARLTALLLCYASFLMGIAQEGGLLGVDFKSFGVASLPGGFEELTTAYFTDTLKTGGYYELQLIVDKDLFPATETRKWPAHKHMQFEINVFLAVTEDFYEPDREYKYVIYEQTGAQFIRLTYSPDRFRYIIEADAPYGLLTIGYKPSGGWWDADRGFIEDILQVTRLQLQHIPIETDTLEPSETIDTLPVVSIDTLHVLDGRKTTEHSVIQTSADSVTLRIYDHLEVDGDSINVWFNESEVVSQHALTQVPKVISMALLPGQNSIGLHAINLGAIEPNTAAFDVILPEKTYKRILLSDLNKSAVFYIYKQPSE